MLVLVALLGVVSLGLPDGVLGVTGPSMRRAFDLPVSGLGVLLAAAMSGYLVSRQGATHSLSVEASIRSRAQDRAPSTAAKRSGSVRMRRSMISPPSARM